MDRVVWSIIELLRGRLEDCQVYWDEQEAAEAFLKRRNDLISEKRTVTDEDNIGTYQDGEHHVTYDGGEVELWLYMSMLYSIPTREDFDDSCDI